MQVFYGRKPPSSSSMDENLPTRLPWKIIFRKPYMFCIGLGLLIFYCRRSPDFLLDKTFRHSKMVDFLTSYGRRLVDWRNTSKSTLKKRLSGRRPSDLILDKPLDLVLRKTTWFLFSSYMRKKHQVFYGRKRLVWWNLVFNGKESCVLL